MKASLRYAATGSVLSGSIVVVLWWFLGPAARRGVLLGAAVALPVQVVAFAVLEGCRTRFRRFLAAWAAGTLVRMAVVTGVAFLVLRLQVRGAVVMLFSLAGFFFLLLLLEPFYFRLELAGGVGSR